MIIKFKSYRRGILVKTLDKKFAITMDHLVRSDTEFKGVSCISVYILLLATKYGISSSGHIDDIFLGGYIINTT